MTVNETAGQRIRHSIGETLQVVKPGKDMRMRFAIPRCTSAYFLERH
jgi:hypothetical protein